MSERTIFLAALEKDDPAQRKAYLDEACAGDPALRERVELLLQSHEQAGSFLGRPALEQVAADAAARAARAEKPTEAFAAARAGPGPGPVAGGETRAEPGSVDLGFLAPSAKPGALGRLGHYEVQEVLGQGGFGVVLKAFDGRLQRVVAIKVLAPAYAASGSARKRFIREARAAAAIKNEHVVAIYDVQAEEQPPYLVMELVDGPSLQEKLDEHGALGVKEILRIGLQTAEGLLAAHKQGLVHRDIKPANILLENGVERVKITDFGLARAVDDTSVTQSGTVAGTPLYMSPEQAEGLPVDPRSDLFSLGSVLYALCTGQPPFRAGSTHAVLRRVIEDAPRPIREINNGIPEWLCALIDKLLAKKPEERFQTANEAAAVLQAHLARLQQTGNVSGAERVARQIPPPLARPTPWRRLGLIAVSCLLGVSAFWFGHPIARYVGNRADLEIVPQPGLTSVIVLQNGVTVTDWLDMRTSHTLALSPGKYQLNPGCKPGYQYEGMGWELTTSRFFAEHTVRRSGTSCELEIQRGERVTVRAIPRPSPPEAPPLAVAPFDATRAGQLQEVWAKHLGIPIEITNGIGMKLRLIPPGKFLMGSTQEFVDDLIAQIRARPAGQVNERQLRDIPTETPQRPEEIAAPYYMGQHEVTVGQFRKFVEATGYKTTAETMGLDGWRQAEVALSESHPVGAVSLKDASAFCAWLSQKEGRAYGLPDEKRWEFACRAGTTKPWYGDQWQDLVGFAWLAYNSGGTAHAVGGRYPNAFGLFDMLGNVEELCRARDRGVVGRGGMFHLGPYGVRCAARSRFAEDDTHPRRGFRVAIVGAP
jgi:formylglycine-generating enzyme required for sulfatase activity